VKLQGHIESEIISVTLGAPWQPPVDLRGVAEEIGAVVHRAYCKNAFTQFLPAGPVIYLSRTADGPKMRFMLAHELAHVMLRKPRALELIERLDQANLLEDEEEFANRIAGTLLVPDSWIETLRRMRPSPELLEEVSSRAGITIAMLITRMAASGIDIALLHWRRSARSWHVVDRPGTPFSLHGCVELMESGKKAIDCLRGEESEVIVECRVDGEQATISGWGYRRGTYGEHAYQFLAPTRDVRFCPTRDVRFLPR
jgi:IrrE N-terminal-like domain